MLLVSEFYFIRPRFNYEVLFYWLQKGLNTILLLVIAIKKKLRFIFIGIGGCCKGINLEGLINRFGLIEACWWLKKRIDAYRLINFNLGSSLGNHVNN